MLVNEEETGELVLHTGHLGAGFLINYHKEVHVKRNTGDKRTVLGSYHIPTVPFWLLG